MHERTLRSRPSRLGPPGPKQSLGTRRSKVLLHWAALALEGGGVAPPGHISARRGGGPQYLPAHPHSDCCSCDFLFVSFIPLFRPFRHPHSPLTFFYTLTPLMQALSGHELQGSLCADLGPVPRPLLLLRHQQLQRPRLRGSWRRAHRGRGHRGAVPGPRGLLDQARLRRLGRGGQGNTRPWLSFTRPSPIVISSHFNLPFTNPKIGFFPLSLPRYVKPRDATDSQKVDLPRQDQARRCGCRRGRRRGDAAGDALNPRARQGHQQRGRVAQRRHRRVGQPGEAAAPFFHGVCL